MIQLRIPNVSTLSFSEIRKVNTLIVSPLKSDMKNIFIKYFYDQLNSERNGIRKVFLFKTDDFQTVFPLSYKNLSFYSIINKLIFTEPQNDFKLS